MSQQKNGSYVGIDLDEFDPESVQIPASLRSRSSKISLLKNQARRHTKKAWSTTSPQLRNVLTKDFWHQALPQSRVFYRESLDDLKFILGLEHIVWRRFLWRFYTIFGPIFFIGGTASVLPLITAHRLYRVSDACQPDSGFYIGFGDYDIWDVSGFFQITLGFGEFTFSTAKTIDVGWDVGNSFNAVWLCADHHRLSSAVEARLSSSPSHL